MAKQRPKYWSFQNTDFVCVPIASGTVVEQGDLISLESNKAVLFGSATDDGTFLGIAFTHSEDGNTDDLVVCTGPVVAELEVVSATYGLGDGLKYNAGGASTNYKLEADGGSNTIAWSYQEKTSAVTSLEVLFDARSLQKLFSVSA